MKRLCGPYISVCNLVLVLIVFTSLCSVAQDNQVKEDLDMDSIFVHFA